MNTQPLAAQILTTCRKARGEGQFLDIDFMLPSVLYNRGGGTEFRFREAGAQTLFERYRPVAEQTGLPMKDVLLWAAQEWDLSGNSLALV
ncbi:hypothetical protein D3C84_380370 [compost metagenome]